MVVGKLLERNAEPDYGYNAANNTYEDLVKAGIIDPLKVCFTNSSFILLAHCHVFVAGPECLSASAVLQQHLPCMWLSFHTFVGQPHLT